MPSRILAAGGAKIDTALVQRVHGHGVAQHVDVAVFLRQALGEWLPLVAAGLAAEDPQLAFVDEVGRGDKAGDGIAVHLADDYLFMSRGHRVRLARGWNAGARFACMGFSHFSRPSGESEASL